MPQANFFLHCDNHECGIDVDFDEPMAEKHIGFQCPRCGSDMLTRPDFEAGMRMNAAFDMMEKLGLARRMEPGEQPGPGEMAARFHYHDGKLTVTEKKRD